jgi:hypothetical protein
MLAFQPEASLIYINADAVLESVLDHLHAKPASDIRLRLRSLRVALSRSRRHPHAA